MSCVFFILFCITSPYVYSKEQAFRFHKVTIENGLSQSTINDIVQDHQGYIWFATQDGLNRFDGLEIKIFRNIKDDPTSLSSSWIEKIVLGSDSLWIQTLEGLDSLNLGTLEVTHWANKVENQAFDEFDSREQGFKIQDIALTPKNELGILTNTKVVLIDLKSSLIFDYPNQVDSLDEQLAQALTFDSRANLYTISQSCLNIHYRESGEIEKHCLKGSGEPVNLNFSDVEGSKVLLESPQGFYTFDTLSKESTYTPVSETRTGLESDIEDVLEVVDGYWLATNTGVKFWSKTEQKITLEYYADNDSDYSLLSKSARSLALSSDGLLWVGHTRGVNFWNLKAQFQHLFRSKDVLPFKASNYVTGILKDAEENLWLGTESSGLFRYSSLQETPVNFTTYGVQGQKKNIGFVAALLEDNEQNLWVASAAGIFVKSLYSDDFVPLGVSHLSARARQGLEYANDLTLDRNGYIWIASNHGIYRVNPKYNTDGVVDLETTQTEDVSHLIPERYIINTTGIYTIYEDLQGYLWIGGNNGLIRLNPLTWKFEEYSHDPNNSQSLSNSDITTIYEDNRGVLWVGTVAGLNRVNFTDTGAVVFKRVTVKDGFINDFVCSILSDSSGNLWISLQNGLVKYHPDSQSVTNFSYNDGLQYSEFYAKSELADSDNGLYFGGINGITYFHPSDISLTKKTRNLFLTSVEQNGKLLNIDSLNGLSSVQVNDNSFVDIHFSSFDFLNASNLKYRYKIPSYSDDWLYLDSATFVRLHYLKLETIKLSIQMQDAYGDWNPNLVNLEIHVKKAFFRSQMAIAVYVFLIVLVLSLFTYFIYRKIVGFLLVKDNHYSSEKAMNLDLIEENKSLDFQLSDLKYSMSEQLYLTEQLRNKVEQFEVSDQLTGFKNKKYIRANINQELSSILNTWSESDDLKGIHLGIFAIDIDNFETINKQYGVLSGNEILKQTSESLKTISYGTDTLVRWEGARLLVLSRAIAKREQMLMAEKIRNIIASRKFDLSNGANIDITCSIGFTRFPFIEKTDKPLTWEQLIFIAEQALEVAKANSKNAWVGIFSNRFTRRNEIERKLASDLPALIVSGQLDYISSIPKSKKLTWH